MPRQNEAPGTQFHTYLAFFSGPIICHWLDLDQHRCREADLCASNDSEGTNFACAKLAASFLCAAPILLHVSPAKTVPPLAEPAITSNTALSLLLGGGDGDAQLPRAKHDLTHMKDNAATSKPTIVVIDGGPAIRDLIEFLLRPWDIM